MLVDYHFESNEDARRLAHWEGITDFGLTFKRCSGQRYDIFLSINGLGYLLK